jgi:hypothetical protein
VLGPDYWASESPWYDLLVGLARNNRPTIRVLMTIRSGLELEMHEAPKSVEYLPSLSGERYVAAWSPGDHSSRCRLILEDMP